ncbi:uncharacterized protein LACBIDRAFT_305262 [Laccaria bicolor S238N-H82]|uniref:Predicted protein n=1 Tax=Laccaria bicolor (strain S238N-H82 / ATCC MYA-4686) TaxID=486041 RepID=B0CTT8_LACBS|nr:uncharacterized protein LACBIDRAFT_305262 [Laccaria bicolor S238N-H82]EDR14553.1 predicted protein [Laccaria bicolor S238N-H82]|eukprot:XP_001875112.1 predicted protein [Laccaria bicolor S238N-H82]
MHVRKQYSRFEPTSCTLCLPPANQKLHRCVPVLPALDILDLSPTFFFSPSFVRLAYQEEFVNSFAV